MITGKTLIEMGYKSGSWFPAAIRAAQSVADAGGDELDIRAAVDKYAPLPVVRVRAAGDARFVSGVPDLSELPGAYKDANSVRAQIAEFGLAEMVDQIEPVGCIMAGDWKHDAPWRNKRKKERMDGGGRGKDARRRGGKWMTRRVG